jgi:uncharacterized protein (DUF1330 family)
MSVYFLGQVQIEDPNEYQKYLQGFFPILEKFHGVFLAGGDNTEVIEGEWYSSRSIIIQFANRDEAMNWHDSPEYQRLAEHRWKSTTSNLVLVRGWEDPESL